MKGLAEAMVHDVGSGLHLHLAGANPSVQVASGEGAGGGAPVTAAERRAMARAKKERAAEKAAGKFGREQSKAHSQATAASKKAITPTAASYYEQQLAEADIYDGGHRR